MKKILSVSLILCMLLTLGVTLASCAHTCEFSDEWSNDSKAHWHACEKKDCEEVEDKEDHKWDEGKITTVATQEEKGVKTFTCTVCDYKKTEDVEFTGLSKEDWEAALKDEVFENFQYKASATAEGSGVTATSEMTYKFIKDDAWAKMTMGDSSEEAYAPDAASANELRKQLVDTFKKLTPYDSYEYDAETKTYKSTKDIEVGENQKASDLTVTFVDGKIGEIKYTVTVTQEGIEVKTTTTVTLSDYGKITLPAPSER